MSVAARKVRKDLSADTLFRLLHSLFSSVPDQRSGEVEFSLADVLMSAFAMFSLKDPSLLSVSARQGTTPSVQWGSPERLRHELFGGGLSGGARRFSPSREAGCRREVVKVMEIN